MERAAVRVRKSVSFGASRDESAEPSPLKIFRPSQTLKAKSKSTSMSKRLVRESTRIKKLAISPKVKQTVSAAGVFKKSKEMSRHKKHHKRRETSPKEELDLLSDIKGELKRNDKRHV
jgi:hypothetical protein